MKVGQIVRFKESYKGYFDHLKDEIFTIERAHRKDDSTDTDTVVLKEIEEVHLVGVDSLELVQGKSYKLYAKYPHSYTILENALENYADDHELKGMTHKEIASHIIEWVNETFSYIDSPMERVVHFLQGIGLDIPYTYHDIYQLGYKEGRLHKTDTDNKHHKFADSYWRFMAMRLLNIAESK